MRQRKQPVWRSRGWRLDAKSGSYLHALFGTVSHVATGIWLCEFPCSVRRWEPCATCSSRDLAMAAGQKNHERFMRVARSKDSGLAA